MLKIKKGGVVKKVRNRKKRLKWKIQSNLPRAKQNKQIETNDYTLAISDDEMVKMGYRWLLLFFVVIVADVVVDVVLAFVAAHIVDFFVSEI